MLARDADEFRRPRPSPISPPMVMPLPAATPRAGFRARVAGAEAFVHVQDMPGQDILDADAFAQHEGGFAAAARSSAPSRRSITSIRRDTAPSARRLAEELARVVRGRAANPRWIKGQMRHGHRGAAEIAETVDNLLHYAALTKIVDGAAFRSRVRCNARR